MDGFRESRFSLATGGILVWRDESASTLRQLTWVSRSGDERGAVGPADRWGNFAIAPDGRTIAADREDDNDGVSISLLDSERGTVSRLTSGAYSFLPLWMETGDRIVYSAGSGVPANPFALDLDGKAPRRLAQYPGHLMSMAVSRDGRWIVARGRRAVTGQGADLFRIGVESGTIEPLLATEFDEREAALSHDGKWLAFTSDENGERAVYVTSFPEPGRRIRISPADAVLSRWRADGREIYYSRRNGSRYDLVAVPLEDAGSSFSVGQPRTLFSMDVARFDVTRDGERFLILRSVAEPDPPLKVVTDWKRWVGITHQPPRDRPRLEWTRSRERRPI